MEQTLPATVAPVTEDVFLADRQDFWGRFTHFIIGGVVFVVVLLVLMTVFLV